MTSPSESAAPPKGLRGALESTQPRRQPFGVYRRFIQNHYDGLPGALTAVTGLLTGHETLAGRLIRPEAFDVRGCKRILDAACGNGRYSRFLLRHADADAVLTSFDLSPRMLQRARARLKSARVSHAVADLTRLPYADASFDAVVCGWVLEHLPDPRPGLRELARVLQPGGKLLLLSTEDTLTGAMCSRLWHCRTYNRTELRQVCGECGLSWQREMWFSGMHRLLKLGGIIVEMRRDAPASGGR
ncbi:MAG TPA: class I SAM-dependent methyltransferase [Gemmataceae bacterium]|jgi:2-polyprenyl-3-methyl-5-hydroxy-6-metoxy-1,4-benzoquinol methylase